MKVQVTSKRKPLLDLLLQTYSTFGSEYHFQVYAIQKFKEKGVVATDKLMSAFLSTDQFSNASFVDLVASLWSLPGCNPGTEDEQFYKEFTSFVIVTYQRSSPVPSFASSYAMQLVICNGSISYLTHSHSLFL